MCLYPCSALGRAVAELLGISSSSRLLLHLNTSSSSSSCFVPPNPPSLSNICRVLSRLEERRVFSADYAEGFMFFFFSSLLFVWLSFFSFF